MTAAPDSTLTGEVLVAWLAQAGITQAQAAVRVGAGLRTMQRWCQLDQPVPRAAAIALWVMLFQPGLVPVGCEHCGDNPAGLGDGRSCPTCGAAPRRARRRK